MDAQCYVSDELTHFVGWAMPNNVERYALLLKILGDTLDRRGAPPGWLQASYHEEFGSGTIMRSDGRKRLSENEAVKCQMLCFCDIPYTSRFIRKYGSFGIALSKQFLLKHGATPVYYIAGNACNRPIGRGGPRNLADRFDELRAEFECVRVDLEEYVSRVDGAPTFLSRLPPPNAPDGHRLLGRLSALRDECEELVFARTKFFTEGLPEHHRENYYMEREWRLPGDGLAFRLENIARIIVPQSYCGQFREDVPGYTGEILPVDLVPEGAS